MSNDMLLELGTEEIPARFIPSAIAMMKESAERLFMENRIQLSDTAVYGTPRRLALIARGLAEVQQDMTTEVIGPPKSAAYDKDGNPTKAAAGFAKGQGVDVSDLRVKNTAKGDYIFIEKHETGKKTRDILPNVLEDILSAITFTKAMRWNNSGARFVRPVRWILSLLNGEPLHVKFAGLESGNISYGHHFMKPASFDVKGIDDYAEGLENNFVIVDHADRRRLIEAQITEIARENGGRVIHDEELLDETTFLTEYPLAICGRFDDVFLTLPKDVLITVMREHQRCFSVEGEDGRLIPCFIGISNTVPKDTNVVRNGYERVVRARLSDAKFFFDSDRRKRLEEYSERLKQVVFMNRLGTMSEKVQRLTELSEQLCGLMSWDDLKEITKRAAQLSKADLMTDMVGEFPELQGIMGFEYAVRQGESHDVAVAIAEHYLPK
ncbi:MAG: glycine--tRNA ligase subunit beta, partial [Nitrospira sp.]|nr:glycine--tRNA ligase subunit beta [Nitrospira sp.]